MKPIVNIILLVILISCNSSKEKIRIDQSKHIGLKELKTDMPYRIFYSEGYIQQAEENAELLKDAYIFLSDIMGAKEQFCLLVVSKKDWGRNAYTKTVLPQYGLGNVVVCPEKEDVAIGNEIMIRSFPKEMTKELSQTYTNENGELDLRLYSDKLIVHELTHSFQDPKNKEIYYQSYSLGELHANMGLYAFYKARRPNELKYITQLTDFCIANPSTDIKYKTLSELDSHGSSEMTGTNYGYYQWKLTKAAQLIIDTYGNDILKSLNDFLQKYDDPRYEKLTLEDYKKKLAVDIDPRFTAILNKLDE